MIIGIDGNEANEELRVGVHQYSYELLMALHKLVKTSKSNIEVLVYLKNPPGNDLPKENKRWKYEIISGGRVWIVSKLMPRLFCSPKPDVFFTPSHYLPPFSPQVKVCTVHDLGYLKFSGQFKSYDFWQLKVWTAISIIVSKYIIAVSKATKKDIVRHYPNASNKTKIIHEAHNKERFNLSITNDDVRRVRNKYHIPQNYILFLGALKPSKNIEGVVRAFSKIHKDSSVIKKISNLKLVIAGKKGWMHESIFKLVKSKKLEDDIIFTDYVDEKDKPALMKGARVFVSPSFYEGFGLTMLESMACGTPVVTSKVASIPEIVGNAGVYCDPNDSVDIARAVKRVLMASVKEYNEYIEKSVKQASKFSWEKVAKQTMKLLKKAVK